MKYVTSAAKGLIWFIKRYGPRTFNWGEFFILATFYALLTFMIFMIALHS